MDTQANKEPKIVILYSSNPTCQWYSILKTKAIFKDASLITEYLPNLAYFLTDFYEKLYDDSLTVISTQPSLTASSSLLSATSSPAILAASATTPPPPKPLVSSTSASSTTSKTSPPIVLKISTKKLEIISTVKIQIVENELCSVLLIYLIVACLEINDWVNLKVLLPAIRYPNNNASSFEKWFLFQFFNYLTEKTIVEQFKHEWFVTLVFDEFLFGIIKRKDEQLQQDQQIHANAASTHSNSFYDQVYKLIDKIYPAQLSSASFSRLVEYLKPKKFVRVERNYLVLYFISAE